MSTSASDNDQTIGEAVAERAGILEKTFNLSPDTAQVAARDKIATGMRNPASADIESDRAAEARGTADADATNVADAESGS